MQAKRVTYTFWVDKTSLKMQIKAQFWKYEACGQTLLPDRLFLLQQRLIMPKLKTSNGNVWKSGKIRKKSEVKIKWENNLSKKIGKTKWWKFYLCV